jgi:hypothetical protein
MCHFTPYYWAVYTKQKLNQLISKVFLLFKLCEQSTVHALGLNEGNLWPCDTQINYNVDTCDQKVKVGPNIITHLRPYR